MEYGDGRIYSGDWFNNLWHGIGTLTDSNGTSYTGQFKQGFKHGKGVLNVKGSLPENREYTEGKLISSFVQ